MDIGSIRYGTDKEATYNTKKKVKLQGH